MYLNGTSYLKTANKKCENNLLTLIHTKLRYLLIKVIRFRVNKKLIPLVFNKF